jgi:UDP-glucose 4-epimerase
MPTVAITGASGALGRRIVSRLADSASWSVVAIDRSPFPTGVAKPRHFTAHRVDLSSAPLDRLTAGADVIVHLATGGAGTGESVSNDLRLLDRTLDAAGSNGIEHVVLLSSATTYGAWANNPVPLTETAPLRPNPDFVYAQQKVAAEQVATEWRASSDSRRLAILRSATTLGHPEARAWLARSVRPTLFERLTTTLPPSQFVHVDDLADAVVHVLNEHLDGVYNVSSIDWLSSEEAHDLFGPPFTIAVPDWAAGVIGRWVERFGERRPPGAASYARAPFVVAADRLVETGWMPKSSSAEAYVAAKRPSPLSGLYARRRQELNLAAVSVGVAGASSTVLGVLRWWRRRVR